MGRAVAPRVTEMVLYLYPLPLSSAGLATAPAESGGVTARNVRQLGGLVE